MQKASEIPTKKVVPSLVTDAIWIKLYGSCSRRLLDVLPEFFEKDVRENLQTTDDPTDVYISVVMRFLFEGAHCLDLDEFMYGSEYVFLSPLLQYLIRDLYYDVCDVADEKYNKGINKGRHLAQRFSRQDDISALAVLREDRWKPLVFTFAEWMEDFLDHMMFDRIYGEAAEFYEDFVSDTEFVVGDAVLFDWLLSVVDVDGQLTVGETNAWDLMPDDASLLSTKPIFSTSNPLWMFLKKSMAPLIVELANGVCMEGSVEDFKSWNLEIVGDYAALKLTR
jgi:hypothetical protein